jgi:ATP-dependent DNA helicase RecG
MANCQGHEYGWVLVGVEDDGTITGAHHRHGDVTDPNRLQAMLANRTRPYVLTNVSVVPVQGKEVIAIQVTISRSPVSTAEGLYKRRALKQDGTPECLPFQFHEMQANLTFYSKEDFSTQVIPNATMADLDPLEFERFRRTIRQNPQQGDMALVDLPDLEIAKALGAIELEPNGDFRLRALALLLFAKETSLRTLIPTHEVAFQTFQGSQVQINDFFKWPLLRIVDELMIRFDARNNMAELMVRNERFSIPDYSRWAFREGLANALIHRDYTRNYAVHVQWREDRLEISSPGGFPDGVRLDNILVTPPKPRNLLLTDAFKRAGLVERSSRGIDKIFEEQLRFGRPAPAYERSSATDVVLVMPGGEANLAFTKFCIEEGLKGLRLSVENLLLLNALWTNHRLTPSDAARITQRTKDEARSILERLVSYGLVVADGVQDRLYELAPAVFERLSQQNPEIRGFNPEIRGYRYEITELPPATRGKDSTIGREEALNPKLLELAKPAWKKKRLPPTVMQLLILKLCGEDWLSPATLSAHLNRDIRSLHRPIRQLQESQLLQEKHPDEPSHPGQAYKITEKGREFLESELLESGHWITNPSSHQ